MTTKERIQAAIENVGEENLDELFRLVEDFVASRNTQPKTGIMAKLKSVKIEAPPDFAANLDQYLSGEKRVEDNLH
jgi:hypothetical protein